MNQYTPSIETQVNIPYGYCQCGCGGLTPLATKTNSLENRIKGKPTNYIPGHNGIRAASTLAEAFQVGHPLRVSGECLEWQGSTNDKGYGRLYFRRKYFAVHRVAWLLANNAEIPDGLCVCHSCDNRLCVNPDHLWLGTDDENRIDKMSKGRQAKGGRIHSAKLSEEDLSQIFSLRADGLLYREIAERFGISSVNVGTILRGESWGHVKK